MNILFWNTHNNKINPYIVSLVKDYCVDVLVMAEYSADKEELFSLLEENQQFLIPYNTWGCRRIQFLSNYADVEAGEQNPYFSIQIIKKKYIICCVHLFTDMYGDHEDERLVIIQQIMKSIKFTEEKINSRKTLIIGDMNEMPYDRGCLNANGFHGLPVLSFGEKPTRLVNHIEYRKFYNPMWNLMGDFSYPPGTYYLNHAKLNNPFWYMLDQVILSKDLLPLFKKESLKIITTCTYADLMDKNMHPNVKISDHFPLICEIDDGEEK